MPALHKVITRALIALALGVSASVSGAVASPAQAATPYTETYLNSYELQVVNAINVQRRARGLPSLYYRTCPDTYAESLALRLRASSTLYHQSMTNLLRGCGATRVSENLARARTPATSLVQLWMNSPVHRANILDRYVTQIGVGTACTSICTTVADFIRP